MANCKYCGQTGLKWYQNPDTQRFSLQYADGSFHRCQTTTTTTQAQQQEAFTGRTTQPPPQPQPQQEAQGPNRYETAYLIPKEDWNHMLEFVSKISAQLTHLSEFYDSVMQEIEALRQMAHEQQSYRKHQQTLAEAEEQYDQDREQVPR